MSQIFAFVVGKNDKHAQRNLSNTISNSIDNDAVFGAFPSNQQEELERIREVGDGFYAWGAVPGKVNTQYWRDMNPGDYILRVHGNVYLYAARVLAKYNRRQFAESVWGEKSPGETWQYMYFLTKPDEIDGHISETGEYLRRGYFGFTKISESNVMKILDDFDTIDNFIYQMLNGPESGVGTNQGLAPVTDQEMSELDNTGNLDKSDVDNELIMIKSKLAHDPKLTEGLDHQTTQISARPRSAAFEIGVKRVYDFRGSICGSGLRTPDQKPEVQSAHIYPKRLDGSDDIRNGVCLCRMHHWAMDVGWLSIADNYTILVRDDLPSYEDYRFIRAYEGEQIDLPSVASAAPDPMYLREHRKLTGFE